MYLARRNFGTLPHAFKQALNISKVNDPAKLSLSKIVATIGPASENVPMIHHVFGAGMGIMRINFSHATYDEADLRVKNMNSCRNILSSSGLDSLGQVKNMCGIMLDTQGKPCIENLLETRNEMFPYIQDQRLEPDHLQM